MMVQDVNRLKQLLAQGVISNDDLNGMSLSGSFGREEPRQNALARALSAQERFAQSDGSGPLPMGSMRNEATGRVIYFQPDANAPRTDEDPGFSSTPYPARRMAARAPQRTRVIGYGDGQVTDLGDEPYRAEPIDYTRPAVDIAGVGKGRYSRDGLSAFVDNPDGTRTKVLLGYNAEGSDRRNAERLAMDGKRAQIEQTREQTALLRDKREMLANPPPAEHAPVKPTAGQDAADKEFAKEYNEFRASGGYADTVKQLGQLREVSDALGKNPGLTGFWVGNAPDAALAVTNPDALAARNAVEEVVQRNLRLILGAQFTQKEGERLIERAYNPRLDAAENKKRVDRLIQQIETAARTKQDAADYFEANGTLRGWGGKIPKLSDFDPDGGEKASFGSAKPMPTSKAALVVGQSYRTPRGVARWNGSEFEAE